MSLELMLEAIVRRVVREELAAATKPATTGMVSVKTYAAARAISVSVVRAAIRVGRLDAVKIGGSVRVAANAEIKALESANTSTDKTAQRAARTLGLVAVGGKP